MTSASAMIETPVENIPNIFRDLRTSFVSGKTKPVSWRKRQIEQIHKMCDEQKDVFASAANADFHRPHAETLLYDCGVLRNECIHTLNHIDEWASDEYRSDSLAYATMDKYVHHEPYGICLIIGAWNYPFQVALSPLIGAIAAGNCAILKPSELAPNSAAIIATMIERYLDTSCIRVVLGAIDQTQSLLKGDINHVFYTGSTAVGKVILKAAAEKMVPAIVECGGKSPVYVADDANLAVTATRLAWGKTINCGQTW
jgi:aldehyde dehydrogenase (NAD+)